MAFHRNGFLRKNRKQSTRRTDKTEAIAGRHPDKSTFKLWKRLCDIGTVWGGTGWALTSVSASLYQCRPATTTSWPLLPPSHKSLTSDSINSSKPWIFMEDCGSPECRFVSGAPHTHDRNVFGPLQPTALRRTRRYICGPSAINKKCLRLQPSGRNIRELRSSRWPPWLRRLKLRVNSHLQVIITILIINNIVIVHKH